MPVRLDLTERVAWLTLDRPPLNVLDIALLDSLRGELEKLGRNNEVSVVVLAGAGERAFSAGVEIKEHTVELAPKMLRTFHAVLRTLTSLPQVTIAAVDGVALGGGFELALACDLSIASRRSQVGLPEIKLACFPPAAIAMLPGVCGRPAASDLVLTGATLSAERAHQVGLVSRLVDDHHYDEELRKVVAELASRSAAVMRLTTRTLRRRLLAGFDQVLSEVETVYLEELMREPDMVEGIQSFIDKRPPSYRS